MDMLEQRFDIELLLILDTINSGPTFRPESLHKLSFPLHATAVGTPWPPLSGHLFDATAAVLGLLRRHCHYFGTPPHSTTAKSSENRRRPLVESGYHRRRPPARPHHHGEPFLMSFHFPWPSPTPLGCSSPPPPTGPCRRQLEPVRPLLVLRYLPFPI
jgi:hypothetical protein